MRYAVLLAALALAQPAFAQEPPVVQHFTVQVPAIDGPEAADASPTVCRAPQGKSDTRIPGPRVCKTQKQWDALHARGLDIGADGKSVVASEKYRSVNPGSCGTTSGCN